MRANGQRSILLVGNFLSSTVSTRSVCEDLADRLSAHGWKVLTTSSEANRLQRLMDMMRCAWRRRRDYRLAQVDVFSGSAFLWAEVVCGILTILQKPYVLTLHGGNLPSFAQRWPRRVRRLLEGARVVTTPSRYLRESMRAYRDDLELLPNPIDLSRYDFCLRERPQPHLIWLRAFHQIYNPVLAPRVLAVLAREFRELRLTMIGPDKGDGSLQEARRVAAELGVERRIEFSGGIAKQAVPGWLNRGDLFLNTTNVDNMPVSVLEAMACGLAVVSTNVGGIPYLLHNDADALLVPPGDPDAMSAAVRRILTEPGLAAKLSRNGREQAEQCDWSAILPRWETIFGSLIHS